jgi:beta-lactamase superfamily II metal-dependent hydrolase
MEQLRIRAYNVLFGDAFLITIPERDENDTLTNRNILIDVGNAFRAEGSQNDVFEPVLENILKELKGRPLDLYIMTHEHMDHVQGLLFSKRNKFKDLNEKLNTKYAWLTASSKPGYYEEYKKAKKHHIASEEILKSIANYLSVADPETINDFLRNTMWINNPDNTEDCVEFLRGLAKKTFYIHRDIKIEKNIHHPFNEVEFEIWAPEADTSVYYGKFYPMALNITAANTKKRKIELINETPPKGVDASSFYNLIERRKGFSENLLSIDQAKNNTSIVFCLKWRNWRLLFPGDAEERSWKEMNKRKKLSSVHFIKISHHGSHNGTPNSELLDKILPLNPVDNRKQIALLSSYPNVYNNVPDSDTIERLRQRCDEIHVVHKEADPGSYIDIFFNA